jgi:hypothetical protein
VRKILKPSEEMTQLIYIWRQQTKALNNYAQNCENKLTGRRFVPTQNVRYDWTEVNCKHDFGRLHAYIFKPRLEWLTKIIKVEFYEPRYRRIIPGPRTTFLDRFVKLPVLPTAFDRALAHSQNNVGEYYSDLRELTQESDVYVSSDFVTEPLQERVAIECSKNEEARRHTPRNLQVSLRD